MHVRKLTRGLQGVDAFAHARPADDWGEKPLDLFLLRRQHTVKILRDQRRQRLRERDMHALPDGLRRPAKKYVPKNAFVTLVIHASDAQLGPQLVERAVQGSFR